LLKVFNSIAFAVGTGFTECVGFPPLCNGDVLGEATKIDDMDFTLLIVIVLLELETVVFTDGFCAMLSETANKVAGVVFVLALKTVVAVVANDVFTEVVVLMTLIIVTLTAADIGVLTAELVFSVLVDPRVFNDPVDVDVDVDGDATTLPLGNDTCTSEFFFLTLTLK